MWSKDWLGVHAECLNHWHNIINIIFFYIFIINIIYIMSMA